MLQELIFSDDQKSRKIRKTFFWIIIYLGLFFNNLTSITKVNEFYNPKSYFYIFSTTSYWFLSIIGTVMLFIKVIIPRYLITKQYRRLIEASIVSWIFMFLIALCMAYIDEYIIGAIECNCNDSGSLATTLFLAIYYTMVFNIPLSVILMAACFMKSLHKEQTLQTKLIAEKSENEINTKRNNMLPEYFLSSIKLLSWQSSQSNINLSKQILLFSNVLSYILYECNVPIVDVEKEIDILRDLVEFENLVHGWNVVLNIQIAASDPVFHVRPLQLINPTISKFLNDAVRINKSSKQELIVTTSNHQIIIQDEPPVEGRTVILQARKY